MKKLFLSSLMIVAATTLFAQGGTPSTKATDVLKFKEVVYNFGKIKQGVPVTHDFAFTNATTKPVVIESATASCGCTTPVKPEAPINKGKQDKITAGFNAAMLGAFTKSITVKVAGVDNPLELKISGEVLNEADYAKYQKEKQPGTK